MRSHWLEVRFLKHALSVLIRQEVLLSRCDQALLDVGDFRESGKRKTRHLLARELRQNRKSSRLAQRSHGGGRVLRPRSEAKRYNGQPLRHRPQTPLPGLGAAQEALGRARYQKLHQITRLRRELQNY